LLLLFSFGPALAVVSCVLIFDSDPGFLPFVDLILSEYAPFLARNSLETLFSASELDDVQFLNYGLIIRVDAVELSF